jgi:hypothetical protein
MPASSISPTCIFSQPRASGKAYRRSDGDDDMAEDNLEYYERRACEEREAETAATSSEAASAHRLLALEYEAQARELRSRTEGAAK